ncbi:hypothetical protein SK128_026406 [Halocaridina rubra]|uniref:Secreted protein n=1 Tax=Halocaridina rubra TaxID=373956 RepID=A0AAN8XES6_HALRR
MISARTICTGLTWCYATAVCQVLPPAVHGAHVEYYSTGVQRLCSIILAPGCSGDLGNYCYILRSRTVPCVAVMDAAIMDHCVVAASVNYPYATKLEPS